MINREHYIAAGLSEANADKKARDDLENPSSNIREKYLKEMSDFARTRPDLYDTFKGRSLEHSTIIGGIK